MTKEHATAHLKTAHCLLLVSGTLKKAQAQVRLREANGAYMNDLIRMYRK